MSIAQKIGASLTAVGTALVIVSIFFLPILSNDYPLFISLGGNYVLVISFKLLSDILFYGGILIGSIGVTFLASSIHIPVRRIEI